ncbi:MAG: hypothetical protein AAGG75_10540 [Bacteroidota bacterium]
MKNTLRFFTICFSLFLLFGTNSLQAQATEEGMNNEKMGEIFKRESEVLEGQAGSWQLQLKGRLLLVLTDESNNRMRIFTPVIEEKEIGPQELKAMLEANFHSALDAKYSLYEEYVISVFTHPLKELTPEQLIDAMHQVANLADNFGTTYSSTSLIFGSGQGQEEEEKRINKRPGGKS